MTSTTRNRPQSPVRKGAVVGAVAVLVAVLAGCDGAGAGGGRAASSGGSGVFGTAGLTAGSSAFRADLVAFDSCEDLLDYYRTQAKPLVGAYGLGGNQRWLSRDGATASASGHASDSAATMAGAAEDSGGGYSGTNNQESGVDEADLIKTNGRIIVTALGAGIHVTDAAAGTRLSTVTVPGARDASSELLLSGDTLIVLSTTYERWALADGAADAAVDYDRAPGPARTTVTRVDLSDPAKPTVLGAVRVEGSYRSARMIADSVRMVMVSAPTGLRFTVPEDNSIAAEEEAKGANQKEVAESTIDDWVPHYQLLDADGEAVGTERLLGCGDLSRPREFAGLSTLSVLTFDVAGAEGKVAPSSAAGVVASGDTVYASTDRLIVATSPWDLWRVGWIAEPNARTMTTALHAFDISDPGSTSYAGSGEVAGRLVNQFALDEEDGVIRVATTTSGDQWDTDSQSSLVVLQQQGQRLVETGRVDGMGLTEHIRSVRYLSPELAAVVTFRETDPLYLVDTSDPAAPKVAGELKIPGYSAYLHPVGDGRLLGVGQDADPETGRVKGLQASLFDISDPSAPARLDHVTWKDANSPVEWDHRAFLWWQGTAYLPAAIWSETSDGTDKADMFGGVLTVDVADRALSEGDRVSTAGDQKYGEGPQRVFVVGDDLWTLDWTRLQRFDLATLAHEATVRLPS